jgi:hypothetical protein
MIAPLIQDILSAAPIDALVSASVDIELFVARVLPKCVELKRNTSFHCDIDTILFLCLRLMRRHPSVCAHLEKNYLF